MKVKWLQDTTEKLNKHYSEPDPSIRAGYKRFRNFRRGYFNTSNNESSRRPDDVTSPEINNKINDSLTGDKKMQVDGLPSAVGIPREEVQNLLHQHLNVKKFPA